MVIKKENNVTIIEKEQGRPFRILQLTDIHLGGGFMSVKQDKLALSAVEKIVKAANADFIVVTGDIVYPIPIFSGTTNNLRSSKKFGSLMERLGVPWTLVFGNHDSETFAKYTKDEIANYYMSLKTCLFEKGDSALTGVGNYSIKLVDGDDNLIYRLMFLDSNSYLTWNFFSGFDIIHDDQTEWYKKTVTVGNEVEKGIDETENGAGANAKSDVANAKSAALECGKVEKSLAFFHIPPKEFKEGWEKCYKATGEAQYHLGFVQEKDNYFGYPKTRESSFFSEMVKLGSCRGMFMGHDHLNTLSITYQGIRLTYGMSIDYLAYHHIRDHHTQRGGTIIEIADDGALDIKLLPLDSLD